MNRYYIGADHIARAAASGKDDSHTRGSLDEAIEAAKQHLSLNPNTKHVSIVKIVALVSIEDPPVRVTLLD